MGRREELEYEIAEMRKRIDSAWFELNNLYDDYETETE